jgi:hypothetical protein
MHRTIARSSAGLAAIALAATIVVTSASAAGAGQLDGNFSAGAPLAIVEPADPQPIVPGHEGDVLLRVSVAMPADSAVRAATPAKRHPCTKRRAAGSRPDTRPCSPRMIRQ